MTDRLAEKDDVRWCDKATSQWSLRANGTGTQRVLMHRVADDDGNGYDGLPMAWRDVATFQSYNDAHTVLRKLVG